MALEIISPANSFVQFSESSIVTSCHFADIQLCLPVFADDDVNFQFFVTGDEAEIDLLCDKTDDLVDIGLVRDCSQGFVVQFTETPERYRLNETTMMYNWPHGLPGARANFGVGECFNIKVIVNEFEACSNCLQAIGNDCDTSVIDYNNDENFAGFNYCASGDTIDGTATRECKNTVIQFTNATSRTINYTTSMRDKYGDVPTVQVYIYDPFSGELTKTIVSIVFDANPVTQIDIDFGGTASGIIIIR